VQKETWSKTISILVFKDKDSPFWRPNGEEDECGVMSVLSNGKINPQETKLGEFPYMALLGYNSSANGLNR